MTEEVIAKLREITPEEQRILDGAKDIDKNLYMSKDSNIIDACKLLDSGKLIQVRPHTRFVHFPMHTHNSVSYTHLTLPTKA